MVQGGIKGTWEIRHTNQNVGGQRREVYRNGIGKRQWGRQDKRILKFSEEEYKIRRERMNRFLEEKRKNETMIKLLVVQRERNETRRSKMYNIVIILIIMLHILIVHSA